MQSKTKIVFKRIGKALLWAGALSGFVCLLVAAVNDKNQSKIKGITVKMSGDDTNFFISEKDIKALIASGPQKNPVGKPVSEMNLAALEKLVERDPWVKSAEIFIDNNNRLTVDVRQRDPLARVFTFTGNSFYLDDEGGRIPVSDRHSARVPVFTGFPSDAAKLTRTDSLLFSQIADIANYISKDTFWLAQVEQVVITEDKKFELIPKLGDHVIEFGQGTDVAKKFDKLLVFYREGLSKVGWNTYTRINIAYEGQVVGTRRDGKAAPPPPPPVDSTVNIDVHSAVTASAPPPKPERRPDKPPERTATRPATATVRPAGQQPRAIYRPNQNNRN
ncbi:hypothetical protein MKQ68_25735 [Chitinophaga horti]|uniref:Cell division protein FtsQ n=1 Tax=Chitinophaga horti TaxID=2920382 RepID=A0ABY6J1E4_9BACT|nr:hypothetical protein [Chitinophaga horti]UYQ93471.1 hypothetical protein MKQ68_25735 [Chitinophaga horti]